MGPRFDPNQDAIDPIDETNQIDETDEIDPQLAASPVRKNRKLP
jgi:hypothetical protein